MAATATQFERQVYAVPELKEDEQVREKAARFIGAVATGAWNEAAPASAAEEALRIKPLESLYDAIQSAAQGNHEAYRMVEVNASTDVIERTIKSGHIMRVDLMVDEAGTIQQYGQTLDSVQANSLRFAADNWQMRRRVEAETRNAFRIKHAYRQGILQDYNFVVFSRAADNMSQSDMSAAGFFSDTMSCAIQVTAAEGTRIVMESAFVAGVRTAGGSRHDAMTINKLLANYGIDVSATDATELLDTPLLVHKSLMPGGVVDVVAGYDAAAGGTFFGESKPRQDYQAYRQKCVDRETTFKPKIDLIVHELLGEAGAITSRLLATQRLHKISEKHMVDLAIQDASINAEVFGTTAAVHIKMARWHQECANFELAHAERTQASQTAQSSSCPTGSLSGKIEGNSAETSNESGDCDFVSKECPLCHKKNVKTIIKKQGNKKHIIGDCGCSKTVTTD